MKSYFNLISLWLIVLRLKSKNIRFNRINLKKSHKSLVICLGGIGDFLILIKLLNNYKDSTRFEILVYDEVINLGHKYLNNQYHILLKYSEYEIIDFSSYSKIYSIRSTQDILRILLKKGKKFKFYSNYIYDDFRLFSRLFSLLSPKFKKRFYSLNHMYFVFFNILFSSLKIKDSKVTPILIRKLSFSKKLVAIHVGGKDPIRRLKLSTIKEIIELRPDVTFTLLGNLSDSLDYPLNEFNYANCNYSLNKYTLEDLGDFLLSVNVVICPDSMIVHYCDLLGVPVIGLMGNALPELYGSMNKESKTFSRNPKCSPCSKIECGIFNNFSCIQDIKPIEIASLLKSYV